MRFSIFSTNKGAVIFASRIFLQFLNHCSIKKFRIQTILYLSVGYLILSNKCRTPLTDYFFRIYFFLLSFTKQQLRSSYLIGQALHCVVSIKRKLKTRERRCQSSCWGSCQKCVPLGRFNTMGDSVERPSANSCLGNLMFVT